MVDDMSISEADITEWLVLSEKALSVARRDLSIKALTEKNRFVNSYRNVAASNFPRVLRALQEEQATSWVDELICRRRQRT